MPKTRKGFTLVELLAVIVVLGLILVIAVPQVMNVINDSKKGVLAASARLIANSAENIKLSNDTMGISTELQCSDVSKISKEDYKDCTIEFVDGEARVTIIGQGKYEGMVVCKATSEEAEVVEECPGPVSFSADRWETIKTAVQDGDTENYHVGDTKTVNLGSLGTHTVRIANKSACPTGANALASETACGFVIEFADIITSQPMNSTSTNAGGWKDSAMRTYVNGTIYDALVAEIGNIIIDTKVVSGHGSGDSSNFESTDKVYLLSTREVWGKKGTSNEINYDTADGDTITRQLDYYESNNVTKSNYSGAIKQYSGTNSIWWLRSARFGVTDYFYIVKGDGCHGSNLATDTLGVSPAFRLG